MKAVRVFSGEHSDFIHDLAYDFTGRRLATCSSDMTIKIWDQQSRGVAQAASALASPSGGGAQGKAVGSGWSCSFTIAKAHSGSIAKVASAHPEFGQVLASASADRIVNIYEEAGEFPATWIVLDGLAGRFP